MLGVERHQGHELPAERRAYYADVFDGEQAPRDMPLELVACADAHQLVLGSAQEDGAAEFPAVRLKENRLEALDLAFLLETGVVLEDLVEPLDRLPFAPRTGAPKPMNSPKSAMVTPLSIRRAS